MVKVLQPAPVTIEEALARPESERVELIRGALVEKAAPTSEHGMAQLGLGASLRTPFDRRPGGRWPGGWWIGTEIDLRLGPELFRPDIIGWRRERCPERPHGRPVLVRPDWICEMLSPSNAQVDRVDKMQSYFAAGIPHYWIADPVEKILEVFRRSDVGYLLVLSAKPGQRVRAEPFDAIELSIDELFGADPPDDAG